MIIQIECKIWLVKKNRNFFSNFKKTNLLLLINIEIVCK